MTVQEILSEYYGYTSFRTGQEELINAQLAGRDVFGVMPTGGGKSICYQIPAMLLPGITLVISPLISLMKDQVTALKNAGIPAAFLNSSLTPEQIRKVYGNLRYGMYKIIYVAPERLLADGFLEVAQDLNISLLAVDEAHCTSQWGQDFRPSYLQIADFVRRLPKRPVVAAFTATATGLVREDVKRLLELRDPLEIITGFDRPNLYFAVLQPKDRRRELFRLLKERRDKSGIIYCATRKEVNDVCALLQEAGYSASRYHAGLTDEERHNNQDDFVYDRVRIMVATNAFGMGIDKSNVSFVIHYNMPKSLEAYYQEAGRAGRDGEPADCILMYSPADVYTAKFLIQHSTENERMTQEELETVMARDMIRLNAMVSYCKTTSCLRGAILHYFGEEHPAYCGACSSCCSNLTEQDITREAQIILSCICRMYSKLGYSLGASSVIDVLRGSKNKKLKERGLDTLSTYGMLSRLAEDEVRNLLNALENQDYLYVDPAHGGLVVTQKANAVLFRSETVTAKVKKAVKAAEKKPVHTDAGADEALMTRLKKLRMKLAQKENVPAYIVFGNATLADMSARKPTTLEEFLNVSGVGRAKAERYADAFLEEIRSYLENQ